MDLNRPLPAGHLMSALIDKDIAHIGRVLPLALNGDLAGPVFPAAYWRKRLNDLLGTGYVNRGQVGQIDSLLRLVDSLEREARQRAETPEDTVGDDSKTA